MKAYRLHGIGDLRFEDIAVPTLREGYALVKVHACGICSSDIPRIYTKGTYKFPTVPGHEFSGTVVSVADEINKNYIGKRVSIFPLIPCKHCEQCKQKHYEMCIDYNYLGSRCDGGFAEYVAVPIWNLVEIGDNTDFITGALFEPFAVALHAVNQANLNGGESVAVIGSGAIAFAVAQWVKVQGAVNVCVVGRNDDKRHIADKLGIDFSVGLPQEKKFDAVIEAVGTASALETAISAAKSGNKIIAMGNPNGDITLKQAVYWQILRRQLQIIGTWNSAYDGSEESEWMTVRDAFEAKIIDGHSLVTHAVNSDNLQEGLQIMKEHKVPYCKVMTIWN